MTPARPNSIWIEGLGPGLFYSVNYERRFFDDLGVRVGASYLAFGVSAGASSASLQYLSFPIGLSYLGFRSGKHGLELGAGVTISNFSGSSTAGAASASASTLFPLGFLQAGYRFHPVESAGFNFRIGVMALVGAGPLGGLGVGVQLGTGAAAVSLVPWGYLSLGASF